MASFLWNGTKFRGLDPSDAELQSQSTPYSCWAACIVNARTLLYGKFMGSDRSLLEQMGFDTPPSYGPRKRDIKEYVALVGKQVGVGAKSFNLILSKVANTASRRTTRSRIGSKC